MSVPSSVILRDVNSSMITRVGYDAAKQELYVEFKGSGKQGPALWLYEHVSPFEYAQLTAAASIGKHFLQAIRGAKTSTRVN